MTTRALCVAAALAVLAAPAQPHNDRPVLRESPARLVECIESTARANLIAAWINVTRGVANKKIRIFAATASAKPGQLTQSGYEIEVISCAALIHESVTSAGAYHIQHDHVVLSFSAAQCASGHQLLAVQLVKALANASPDLFWSTPAHAPVTIQAIAAGL